MKQEQNQITENIILGFFSHYGQFALIFMIITVMALMILPIAPFLLDMLLAVNITGALLVLILAVSVSHPMKLVSFPSLLLMCTLFRLGLNISSTRLILSRGDAGQIIQTFGTFVTSGNIVVGLIIFLVLLIIQYIVVSKGAERVAEVAARFTLDALPGKQMSIDADLRAGLLTRDEASVRRSELIRESKLYGSMDGAMKFVKGDTIAGFVITIINIVGGLILGVFDQGLAVGVAARIYSNLTIGDGLVTQIPALLVSMAAGFMVTRVGDDQNEKSLGAEIGTQIFLQPVAIFTVAVMALFIGFIPGFPLVFFMIISLGLMSIAVMLFWRKRVVKKQGESVEQHCVDDETKLVEPGFVPPLKLVLSPLLYQGFLKDERWQYCLQELFPQLKAKLSRKMGVLFPDLKIAVDQTLSPHRYEVRIYDVPVDEGFLSTEHCVVRNDAAHKVSLTVIAGNKALQTNTVHGTPVRLFELTQLALLNQQGVSVLAPEEMLLKHLGKIIIKYASEFIGIQEVKTTLSSVEKYHPELVREVVPRMLSIQKLTEVIKRLVDENISVKDFRAILEIITVSQPGDKDAVDLTELVRMGLNRQNTHQYTQGTGCLDCFGLDSEIEEEIRQAISKNETGCYLMLDPDRIGKINQAIKQAYQNHAVSCKRVVLLTEPDIRRYVKKLVATEMPDIAVLSYQELRQDVVIAQRDTISLYSDLESVQSA